MNQNSTEVSITTRIERMELMHNGYPVHFYVSGNSENELIIFLH